MSERDEYPPGVPCWVDTLQPDHDAALRFYQALMGWDVAGPGTGGYYVARASGRDVAGIGVAHTGPAAWHTYVSVTSADEAADRARDAGGTIQAGPFDVPPAGRLAVIEDPAGATFCVWEPGLRRGAQLINAPGAWSMSLLSTPDPEAAARYYHAVFGWEAEPFGDGGVALFRLPDYVGGLPQQPVPRDVVAVVAPGERASWNVDFWVDDAAATATRAQELGGAIVVPPHLGPVSPQAVIADPAGATLSVTTDPNRL